MQTSAVTYKIERYTIDQLESKIKTYGKTMSKKKSKKIRKEQAQELSSAEPEHPGYVITEHFRQVRPVW